VQTEREYKEGIDDPYGSQEAGDDVQIVEERLIDMIDCKIPSKFSGVFFP